MSSESSSNSEFIRYGRYLLYGPILVFLLILVSLGFIGIIALIRGDIAEASTYAEFIGGLGIIGLILLTGWYAYHTRRMANQQWATHKEEIEDRRRQRQTEVNALRVALREEIGKIRYLDDLADEYEPGHSTLDPIVPQSVYRGNVSQIGLLAEEEVDLVVEFYTRATDVEKHMKVQREQDLSPTPNMLDHIEKMGEGFMNGIFKLLTFGRCRTVSEERAEIIRGKLRELGDAQDQALSALEDNIPKESKE